MSAEKGKRDNVERGAETEGWRTALGGLNALSAVLGH